MPSEFDSYVQDYKAIIDRGAALTGETFKYFIELRVDTLAGELAATVAGAGRSGCGPDAQPGDVRPGRQVPARGCYRRHGDDPGRERQRQGGGRPLPPRAEPAQGWAVCAGRVQRHAGIA